MNEMDMEIDALFSMVSLESQPYTFRREKQERLKFKEKLLIPPVPISLLILLLKWLGHPMAVGLLIYRIILYPQTSLPIQARESQQCRAGSAQRWHSMTTQSEYLCQHLPNTRLAPVGVYFIANKSSVSESGDTWVVFAASEVSGWFRRLMRHSSPATPTEKLKHNGDNLLSSSWWTQGMDLSSSINTWTFMSEGWIRSLRHPVLLWDYCSYYCAANSNTSSWNVLD